MQCNSVHSWATWVLKAEMVDDRRNLDLAETSSKALGLKEARMY